MYNKIPVNKSLMFVRRRRAKRLLLLQPAEITLGTNFIKAKKFKIETQSNYNYKKNANRNPTIEKLVNGEINKKKKKNMGK